MEERLWLVEWSNSDGIDQYEIVEATTSEAEALETRMRRASYFREWSIVLVNRVSMPFDLFDEYLDDLEVPR